MGFVYDQLATPPSDYTFKLPDITDLFAGGLGAGGYDGYFYSAKNGVFTDAIGAAPAKNNGDQIRQWRDLSGNAKHLTTNVAANLRPILTVDGYNQSVAFAGTTGALANTAVNCRFGQYSLFIKYLGTVAGLGLRVMMEGLGTNANDGVTANEITVTSGYTAENQQQRFYGHSGVLIGTTGAAPTPLDTYTLEKDGATMRAYRDGALVQTATNAVSADILTGNGRIVVGASSTQPTPNNFRPFTGRIGAILKINKVLTQAEKDRVYDFFRRYPMT